MKVYLCLEEPDCRFTMVFLTEPSTTVQDITNIFQDELNRRLEPQNLNHKHFAVKRRSRLVASTSRVEDIAKTGETLVIVRQLPDQVASNTVATSVSRDQSTSLCEILKQGADLEASHRYDQVVLLYKSWLKQNSKNDPPAMYTTLVRIYLQAERPEEALPYAETGFKRHKDFEILTGYVECLLALHKAEQSLEILLKYSKEMRGSGSVTKQQKYQIQTLLCRSYQAHNQRDMAVVLAQGVLREDPNNKEALREFALLTFDLGEEQALQATGILLSALVQDRADKTVQRYLADLSRKPKGLYYMEKAAGGAWNTPASLVLLANIFRDHAALDSSLEVLTRAVTIAPNCADSRLAHAHLLEVLGRLDDAVQSVSDFSNCTVPTSEVFSRTATRVQQILVNNTGSDEKQLSLMVEDCLCADDIDFAYTENDLTVLAIWYTLVKILYLQGSLAMVRGLCTLLDPCYASGKQHATRIKNEAAYFGCVAEVMKQSPSLPDTVDRSHCLYLVGDSHCMSPGWRQIKYNDNKYTLCPILSTGTKIWHLRRGSDFYTKHNFNNVISSIPRNSAVIMVFGEIDCREFLPSCVSRCRYDTLEVACDRLADIYVSLLLDLKNQYDWTIFVHPVPPVLDITRPYVKAFNQSLHRRVSSSGSLQWLDFEKDLLTENGQNLRQMYELDGTHLHPCYTELLQGALK